MPVPKKSEMKSVLNLIRDSLRRFKRRVKAIMSTSTACPALPGTVHKSIQEYKYSHLNPSCQEIRLLSLFPGQLSDDIICELATCSLEEEPKYDALSYVWGDQSIRQHITLDGTDFSVTANLYTALQFLRNPKMTRTLWIDAICINQECIPEREHQVQLMGMIYSGAEIVLCWLGDPNQDGVVNPAGEVVQVDDVLASISGRDSLPTEWHSLSECMEAFLQAYNPEEEVRLLHGRFDGLKRSKAQDTLAAFAFLCSIRGPQSHPPELPFFEIKHGTTAISSRFRGAFNALERIVNSAWWDRVWTVQEAMLAKKIWLVHFHLATPYENLTDAAWWLNSHVLHCCGYSLPRLPESEKKVFHKLIQKGNELQRPSWTKKDEFSPEKLAIRLRDFRSRKATDPRDKINALLGLSRWDRAEPITPSYSISPEQVYLNATMKIIEEDNSLDILEGNTCSTSSLKLPSWVPDWTLPNGDGFRHETSLYNAGGDRSKVQLCCDSILIVGGVEFDTVTSVGKVCRLGDDTQFSSDLETCLEEWEKMAMNDALGSETYSTGQSRSDAFKRTLGGDVVSERKLRWRGLGNPPSAWRADESYKHPCISWWHMIAKDYDADTQGEEVYEWLLHIQKVIVPVIENNSLFLTERGFMGIGPSGMAAGDKVVVLRGGKLPFVLRRSNERGHGRKGCKHPPEICFQLVGTSYVHGIMDGQALEDDQKVERDVHLC